MLERRFETTSMSLQVHIDITSLPLRQHPDFASKSPRARFKFTAGSLGAMSISSQRHIDTDFRPARYHVFRFDATSVSLRAGHDPTSFSLRSCTLVPLRFHTEPTVIELTSVSLWLHFLLLRARPSVMAEFTSVSCFFLVDVTAK